MRRFIKTVLIFIAAGMAALFFYWGKCQLNINLIHGFAWERPFPFLNALQRKECVTRPRPGVVFTSSFDELFPDLLWGSLWAREEGSVTKELARGGRQGSRCLRVRNSASRDWAYHTAYIIEVTPGDTFSYEAWGRVAGKASGAVVVTLFDASRKVINWGFAREPIIDAAWERHSKTFVIPSGVSFIRLSLTGSGAGDADFDDIKLFLQSAAD